MMRPTATFVLDASLRLVAAGLLAQLDDQEVLKVAVAQRGQWDTAVAELGQRAGIYRKRGLTLELLYTQGGPEAYQAVISGSMDVACGGGIEAAIGAFG